MKEDRRCENLKGKMVVGRGGRIWGEKMEEIIERKNTKKILMRKQQFRRTKNK